MLSKDLSIHEPTLYTLSRNKQITTLQFLASAVLQRPWMYWITGGHEDVLLIHTFTLNRVFRHVVWGTHLGTRPRGYPMFPFTVRIKCNQAFWGLEEMKAVICEQTVVLDSKAMYPWVDKARTKLALTEHDKRRYCRDPP